MWNLTFSFLCFHKNFSLVLLQITNYLYSITNAKKKKNMICFILVQGFCPLKIKITQFPDGFCLNILTSLQKLGFQMDYETRIYTLTPEINKTNKPLSNKSNNKIFKYLLNNTLCSLPENLTCLKITKYYEKKWNWMPSFANQLEPLHTTTSSIIVTDSGLQITVGHWTLANQNCVWQNPTWVWTLCPDNFYIINHFTVRKN